MGFSLSQGKTYKPSSLHIPVLKSLDREIIAALEEKGIHEPTEIQKLAIPKILEGKNVLIISPTGSGKTEAAMLPIMQRIMRENHEKIACIYITPLRALNRDMLRRLKYFSKKLGLKIAVRHGDTTNYERRKQSLNPPHILITTPETFQILFLGKRLRKGLKNVRFVVIDEVHELAEEERGAQLTVALERLRNLTDFQIIGLSATIGNREEIARFLSPNKKMEIVEVKGEKDMLFQVRAPSKRYEREASLMGCDVNYASALVEMWNEASKHNSTILFVNTRCTAEDIGMRYNLWLDKPPIEVHHGSLSREHRIRVEDRFKEGELKMIICTSSLELGIDVGSVDLVLQYNSPRQVRKLVQRVGRSGHREGMISKGIIYGDNPVELWEAATIVGLAKRGYVENARIRDKPLMVLFNKIVAMANSCGKLNARFAYETVHRAYPFRNLTWEEFERVLLFAKEIGKIWYDGMEFGKSRGGLRYFYDNISMIPDEKSYRVMSIDGKYIGHVDEKFISSLNPGETFVLAGRTWRLISIGENRVTVEYIRDISLPPSWIGEEIPVPYEVAIGTPDYESLNSEGRKILENFKMWKENEIVIERGKGYVFMGVRGGTKVNYTLGLLLSAILSQKLGESVDFSITPYSVVLFHPRIKVEDVKKLLTMMRGIRNLLRIAVRNSRMFRYIFLHVARKMGVIRRDADLSGIRLEKIVDSYRNTILYDEVVNKILWDYMDVDTTEKILEKIREGEMRIIEREISEETKILMEAKGDTSSPILATGPILEAVKNRLLNETMLFLCLSCGRSYHIKVRDFQKAVCPFCGSVKVVLLKPYEEEIVEKIKKGKFSELRREEIERLTGISHLLRTHKRVGAMVLAGRGIGLRAAARILEIPYRDEMDIVKRVLREELKYARNRRFWN